MKRKTNLTMKTSFLLQDLLTLLYFLTIYCMYVFIVIVFKFIVLSLQNRNPIYTEYQLITNYFSTNFTCHIQSKYWALFCSRGTNQNFTVSLLPGSRLLTNSFFLSCLTFSYWCKRIGHLFYWGVAKLVDDPHQNKKKQESAQMVNAFSLNTNDENRIWCVVINDSFSDYR